MMPFLGIEQSLNAGFSLDMSSDRFTGKPVSQTTGLYYDYLRWYDPSMDVSSGPDSSLASLSHGELF